MHKSAKKFSCITPSYITPHPSKNFVFAVIHEALLSFQGHSFQGILHSRGLPPALQAAPETEEADYDGHSGENDDQSESSAHGEENLGGDCGGSFRTLQIGGVGSKSPIGLQLATASDDGGFVSGYELGSASRYGWDPPQGDQDGSGGLGAADGDNELHVSRFPAVSSLHLEENSSGRGAARMGGAKAEYRRPTRRSPGEGHDRCPSYADVCSGRSAALPRHRGSEAQDVGPGDRHPGGRIQRSLLETRRSHLRPGSGSDGGRNHEAGALEDEHLPQVSSPPPNQFMGALSAKLVGADPIIRIN